MDYTTPTSIISSVGDLLRKRLPSEKQALIEHIAELEALRYPLAEEVVKQHKIVAEVKRQMLHPKDKEFTELDRNVMLDAHIAVIRRDYELLVKLDELIRDRMELTKTILTLL